MARWALTVCASRHFWRFEMGVQPVDGLSEDCLYFTRPSRWHLVQAVILETLRLHPPTLWTNRGLVMSVVWFFVSDRNNAFLTSAVQFERGLGAALARRHEDRGAKRVLRVRANMGPCAVPCSEVYPGRGFRWCVRRPFIAVL